MVFCGLMLTILLNALSCSAMGLKHFVKNSAEAFLQALPMSISRYVPHGLHFAFDLHQLPVVLHPQVIFDVGANRGQTVKKLKRWFPQSIIHCFEPVPDTLAFLKSATRQYSNIHYHPYGLAKAEQEAIINLLEDDSMNTLYLNDSDLPLKKGEMAVQLKTLDQVMAEEAIPSIDLLKIDTEGADLDVLQGASLALADERIRFIQVESGMNPFNDRHIPYHEFHDLMAHFGYLPFGLYEQHLEWNGQARLRFVNAVFVCPSVGNQVHR